MKRILALTITMFFLFTMTVSTDVITSAPAYDEEETIAYIPI